MGHFTLSGLAFLLSCCCLFFGLCPIGASADALPSGAVQLSSAQTVSVFGNSISAKYQVYDGVAVQWNDCTFSYDHTETITACNYYSPSGQDLTNRVVCWYACFSSSGLTQNPAYPSFVLNIDKTISDFQYFDFAFCSYVSSVSFSSPISALGETSVETSAGVFTPFVVSSSDTSHYGYVSIGSNQRLTAGFISTSSPIYVDCINFSDLQSDYGIFWIGIVCPVVSSGFSSESGDHSAPVTTAPAGNDYNDKLDNISSGISGLPAAILSGLESLFIPDDSFLEDWITEQESFLSDHLGALYDAEELLTDFCALFVSVTPNSVLSVPTVDIPLKNNTFHLGGWTVNAKINDSAYQVVYTGLALIIDFLAAAALTNALRKKLELFLYPENEAIPE